jgi:hypothetical protein
MKACLEFDLPREQEEYHALLEGANYKSVVEEIEEYLNRIYNHEDKKVISIKKLLEKIDVMKKERTL